MLRLSTASALAVVLVLPAAAQCEIDRLDPQAPANIASGVTLSGPWAFVPMSPLSTAVFARSGANGWSELFTIASDGDPLFLGSTHSGWDEVVAFGFPDGNFGSGSAYLYERGDAWSTGTTLVPTDRQLGDMYGQSLAGSGGLAVVGAPMDNSLVGGFGPGKAHVFERGAGGAWNEVARFDPHSFSFANPGFGEACATDGDTIVVGAPTDDGSGVIGGAVYVFERDVAGWVEVQKLVASAPEDGAMFGASVALDGERLLVGAPEEAGRGAVHVFTRSGGAWLATQTLTGSDSALGDRFGQSIDLDGGWAVCGASAFDVDVQDEGKVYAFRDTGGVFAESSTLVANDAPPLFHFGSGLSLDGNQLLVATMGPHARLYSLGIEDRVETCSSTPNSTGGAASISLSGCDSRLANELVAHAAPVPSSTQGQLILSNGPAMTPLGNGFLCVAAPILRGPVVYADAGGTLTSAIDLAASGFEPGSTWYVQAVFRDAGVGAGFDTSDAVRVVVRP